MKHYSETKKRGGGEKPEYIMRSFAAYPKDVENIDYLISKGYVVSKLVRAMIADFTKQVKSNEKGGE